MVCAAVWSDPEGFLVVLLDNFCIEASRGKIIQRIVRGTPQQETSRINWHKMGMYLPGSRFSYYMLAVFWVFFVLGFPLNSV